MIRGAASMPFFAAMTTLLLGACSSSKAPTSFTPIDGGPPRADATAPTLPGDGGDASSCRGTHCSSDLHAVVDCNNQVVTMCPPDQGCAGTGCIAPCDAAKANRTNIGCDYYAVDPDVIAIGGPQGGCYAAFIANTWDTPVTLSVDFAGQTLDPSTFAVIPSGTGASITYAPIAGGQLAPGEVGILFLNRLAGAPPPPPGLSYDCPAGITPAITTRDAAVHGTGLGSAFHISTNAPVVAYDIFPYGGGRSALTSATLLLPTTAWDTNYIAVDAYKGNTLAFGTQPFIDVVAQADGTSVTINPTADVTAANGVPGAPKGVATTYTLNRGQVLELASGQAINVVNAPELTGSIVQASAPVGVWGGESGLNVDENTCCTDTGHQQIPPVSALGHEYVAARYRNRYAGQEETPPWRLVGAVAGTTLTYEPAPPANAPTTLDVGQLAEFNAAGPFVVRSQDAQHPFYMAAYMTGSGPYDMMATDGRGDAEFVNVIPPAEYLSSYVFFTDPTYPETDLVVVRTKGPSGFADVLLDCAGALTGWQPADTSGNYEYTRIDLVSHNFAPQGNCNNGRHEIHSDNAFGLTVWGWGSAETGTRIQGIYTQYVSYAYPAGASVQPINTVVVPPNK